MTKQTPGQEYPPPQWALRFLSWFCPSELYEGIEGDLLEQYESNILGADENSDQQRRMIRKAKWKFILSVIKFFRPGIIFRNTISFHINTAMLTNYFKVAIRVMFRSKTFSAINVLGLCLGISGALLLFLWVHHEFTFDDFHERRDSLYKVWNRSNDKGNIACWDVTPRILAPTLKEKYATIESATSYADWDDQLLFTVGEKRLLKSSGVYVDPDFFAMFTFPFVKGNPKQAFQEPASIVVTEKFARELYGDADAYGETVNIGASGATFPLVITGVLKDLPINTEFDFDYLIPFQFVESLQGGRDENWGNNSVHSYIRLKEGGDVEIVNQQIKNIVKENRAESKHMEVFLYPLSKMRLYSRFENGVPAGGRIEVIRMLAILGVCLIAMACINFINLSTARAQRRAKEVAVRKVAGASQPSLITQFLLESVLISFCASAVSILVASLSLPFFNNLIHQQLTLDLSNINFWLMLSGLTIVVGVLAGGYPALYLSGFRPIRILKGFTISSSYRSTLRFLLVVIQFGFAVVLIISAIVINRQISFVQKRDSGYSKDNLVFQYMTGDLGKNFSAYKNDLLQSGVATSITRTSSPITDRWSNTSSIEWEGKDPDLKILFERFYQDENLSTTAVFEVIDGRDMNLALHPTDSSAALINETAARAMGFKTSPVGEIIRDNNTDWHIIGVIKDFILTSPFQKVEPIVFFGAKSNWAFNVIHIRLNPSLSSQEAIQQLELISKKYNPEYPVEYQFVDQAYAQKFARIEATRSITNLFSAIAIIIAGLGLLGLSTYMTEVRMKEIGIRKVMGGSVWSITAMLSTSSLKPILFAIIIFSPLGWLTMDWWLRSYAYRVSIDGWVFALTAISMIGIAMAVISLQTIRAANTNPVDTLRNE